jgi:hypothetical protein
MWLTYIKGKEGRKEGKERENKRGERKKERKKKERKKGRKEERKKKNPYGYSSTSVNRNTVYMSLFLEEGE